MLLKIRKFSFILTITTKHFDILMLQTIFKRNDGQICRHEFQTLTFSISQDESTFIVFSATKIMKNVVLWASSRNTIL